MLILSARASSKPITTISTYQHAVFWRSLFSTSVFYLFQTHPLRRICADTSLWIASRKLYSFMRRACVAINFLIEDIGYLVKRRSSRWFGHCLNRSYLCCVSKNRRVGEKISLSWSALCIKYPSAWETAASLSHGTWCQARRWDNSRRQPLINGDQVSEDASQAMPQKYRQPTEGGEKLDADIGSKLKEAFQLGWKEIHALASKKNLD